MGPCEGSAGLRRPAGPAHRRPPDHRRGGRRPAQLICFDLPAHRDVDLRGSPLAERRQRLARLLAGQTPPVVLCQQTGDLALAREWLATLGAGGVEGIVIKAVDGRYPTQHGQRVWWKWKARQARDMIAIGVVGDPAAPTSLVLALPSAGAPRAAGATTVLPRAAARRLGPLLHPTGEIWHRRLLWGSAEVRLVHAIDPVVVEVSADEAVDGGVLRHPARLLRLRADLEPSDLDPGE